jgi:hypothetical protein
MKQYAVLKGYTLFRSDVVEEFNELEDAQQYCDLMNKTHDGDKYAVYKKV